MLKGMTISDAAHRWVSEMNTYPQGMIPVLMDVKPEEWREVTAPSCGRRVYVYNLPEEKPDGSPYESTEHWGVIEDCFDQDIYQITTDDGESVLVKSDDFDICDDKSLPIRFWAFDNSPDNYWLREMGGIKIMSECGFRIYENEEWGYFFGIDGVGYDFYEAYWIPLYKKRGLQWHDPEAEKEANKKR